jgi:NAD(P)-dependent dehydrogenase (short-subunit alcohol dehydrogenase family)
VPAMRVIQDVSIELVISNAGVAFEESASTVSKESYERMFLVNTLAPMLLVSSLRSKIHHAAIISISSVSDRIVEKDFALYCASKAANTRYFESLAHELKEAKVFTLLPDYVDTTMLRELQAGRNFDWEATLKVDDVARFIVGLTAGMYDLASGSNIIVINNSLKEDLRSVEMLYGFNTDTKEVHQVKS